MTKNIINKFEETGFGEFVEDYSTEIGIVLNTNIIPNDSIYQEAKKSLLDFTEIKSQSSNKNDAENAKRLYSYLRKILK